MDKGISAGVCCPDENFGYSRLLEKFSIAFLTDVCAILMCCRTCIDKGYKGKCVHICSDSKMAHFDLQRYNLPLISFGSAIPCFVSLLRVIVSFFTGYLVTRLFLAMKLLMNWLEMVLLPLLLFLSQTLEY